MPLTFTDKDILAFISYTVCAAEILIQLQRNTTNGSQIVDFHTKTLFKMYTEF